ncbi:FliO/MopB family protein [Dyella sp. 2RAB6]|uniref:FliO/MopB family protein n=1 Tax=Dyella sp. 2RAB6 TaxID=3232992 RepID=UPI003F93E26B
MILLAMAAVPAAEPGVGAELLRVCLSLIGIIALIFAAGWLGRRAQGRARPGGRRIRCVESFAVGTRDRLLLLEADGKRLLVGVGQGGMRTLHVYEGDALVAEVPPSPPVPAFADLLGFWKRK